MVKPAILSIESIKTPKNRSIDMKNTQKGLLLAVVLSLASGQTLQAFSFSKTLKAAGEAVKSGAETLSAAAATVDPDTKALFADIAVTGALAYTGGTGDAKFDAAVKEAAKLTAQGKPVPSNLQTIIGTGAAKTGLEYITSK